MNRPQHRSLLTKREREIFELLIEDYSTREISTKLGISEN
jgi:LuxR family transcriptional regulator of spore coat protein